jgi:hypothetical protein
MELYNGQDRLGWKMFWVRNNNAQCYEDLDGSKNIYMEFKELNQICTREHN